MRSGFAAVAAAAAVWSFAPSIATAETAISYVELEDGGQALLYTPEELGQKASVGLIQMHSFSSTLDSPTCTNMAERGYRVLCADSQFTNNDLGYKGFEDHAPAIASAIDFMRSQEGMEKVVLIGHSMGAPMMAFYQNVAENGPGACQDAAKIMPCDADGLEDLSSANAIILLDPHFGEAFGALTYVDPAVTDPDHPRQRDASLDMFDPANGYSEDGATYPAEFRERFFAAQAERNADLIAEAQERYDALQSDETSYEDMPFFVPGARARLLQPDASIMKETKSPHPLLKGDDTTEETVLTSVRVPSGGAARADSYRGALPTTLRRFLGNYAIRTTDEYAITADDVTGVDWDSSATSSIANARGITVPMLVMVMTGHYFLRAGEMIVEAAGSEEVELVGVEGASHGFSPCAACAEEEGQFGDTVSRMYDYIDQWIADHV